MLISLKRHNSVHLKMHQSEGWSESVVLGVAKWMRVAPHIFIGRGLTGDMRTLCRRWEWPGLIDLHTAKFNLPVTHHMSHRQVEGNHINRTSGFHISWTTPNCVGGGHSLGPSRPRGLEIGGVELRQIQRPLMLCSMSPAK